MIELAGYLFNSPSYSLYLYYIILNNSVSNISKIKYILTSDYDHFSDYDIEKLIIISLFYSKKIKVSSRSHSINS